MSRHLLILNHFLFPVLAASSVSFLAWDLVAGGEIPNSSRVFGVFMFWWTHGAVSVYLDLIGKQVEGLVDGEEWPDWVRAQSEKNRRKARLYLACGVVPFPLIHLLRDWGLFGETWLTGLLAANLAFQVGAFVGEYVIMAAQARLLRDAEGWGARNSG
jgi:hypothetical protein